MKHIESQPLCPLSSSTDFSFREEPLSEVPFEDLTPPASARDPRFGGESDSDQIDYRRIKVSLGDRPLSWRVRHLFEKAGMVLPKGLMLYEQFDVWIIAHAVSVSDRGEFATLFASEVDAVGYEAEFDAALLSTVGLQPEPEVVRNVGGSFEASVRLGHDGSVGLPHVPSEAHEVLDKVGLPLVGGAKLSFSTKTELFGRLTFGVWTPRILATGYCSSRCEWLFNRDEVPLRNSQVMFQTALVPAGIPRLKFRVRAYALIRSVGFIPIPSRFETKWLDVETSPVAESGVPA